MRKTAEDFDFEKDSESLDEEELIKNLQWTAAPTEALCWSRLQDSRTSVTVSMQSCPG